MSIERTSVGLDVHARSVVGAGIDGDTGEVFRRRMCLDNAEILAWIRQLPTPSAVVYEAGPTGFGLARYLTGNGVDCVVAAPSKLQRPAGDKVKTDLLTELTGLCFGWRVRGGSALGRFAARDQRRGCTAEFVPAGGVAGRVA